MKWRLGVVILGAGVVVAMLAADGLGANLHRSHVRRLVRLDLAHRTLRAGQTVQVTIVNRASRPLTTSDCFDLQLRERRGWRTITRTRGVRVGPCQLTFGGPPWFPHSRGKAPVALYDDLRPGVYRVRSLYKLTPWGASNSLRGHHHSLSLKLRILKFRTAGRPRLSERRIRRIAQRWAAAHGDRRPRVIRYAQGTRFSAEIVSQGGGWGWSWVYLVGMRGHFKRTGHDHGFRFVLRGSASSIVVSAKTGRVEDFTLWDHYPHLAKLGPVSAVSRR